MEYAETAGLYELLKGVTYGSTNLADFITAGQWKIGIAVKFKKHFRQFTQSVHIVL